MYRLYLLLAIILCSVSAYGQGNKKDVDYYTGAPTGSCPERIAVDRVTGNGYTCVSGVWTLTSIANAVAGVSSSVDSEIALFSGTGGKTLKRATTTGILKGTSGVIGSATAGTDYENPLTFTSPLVRTVNAISIPVATSSVNGYLSSTDWSTFNNKQAAITFGTGIQTALGVNIGSAGAPVMLNGAGGTPSSIALPNATALPDSALSANVPLLNAANTFTANQSAPSLKATGTSGAGYLELVNQASAPSTPTSASRIFVDASNRLSWIGTNGFVRTFDGTANTANRVYVLPDVSGTVATSANTMFAIGGAWAAGVGAGATNYFSPVGGLGTSTENNRRTPSPVAGTLKGLYLLTTSTQPNDGGFTVTLRINGSDTNITFTVAANATAGVYSDTTHTAAISIGDNITIRIVNASGSTTATLQHIILGYQ